MSHSSDSPPKDRRSHPCLALAAYADALVTGARVAVFGDATLELPLELLDRGARLVHVYDHDPTRIAEATARGHERALYFGALRDQGDIGVRDGAFDLVVVPDLSFAPRPEELIDLVARVVSDSGAAILASPNPEAKGAAPGVPGRLGYYELYEAVAERFTRVRMIGQVPFAGWALAEFSADEDLEPTIDTSLVDESKEPAWFVVLASTKGVRLDSFALIEVPGTEPAVQGESAIVLERERDEARAAQSEATQVAVQERLRAAQAEQRIAAFEREALLLRERIRSLEQSAGAAADEKGADLAGMEQRLQERGRELAEARAELARRERLLREILASGFGARAAGEAGGPATSEPEAPPTEGFDELRRRLDELAREVSQREADRIAAGWKITQLERELARVRR